MEQDTVQINTPDFDPDIDGPNPPRTCNNTVVVSVQEHLISPEPEVSDAVNFQEEDTDGDLPDVIYNNSEESHWYDIFAQDFQNHTTEQNQITSGYSIDPEEIPELEEDWDNGQFNDADTNLITRHNTHSEVRELEGNTPNICLIYQTINTMMKRIPCSIPAQIQIIMGHQ